MPPGIPEISLKLQSDCSFDVVLPYLIDLEAFDTVNHSILCEKLNYYGFRGKINELIKSFLYNRFQYVSINGFDSIKLDLCYSLYILMN